LRHPHGGLPHQGAAAQARFRADPDRARRRLRARAGQLDGVAVTGSDRPGRQVRPTPPRVRHARSDEPSWRNPFPDTMLDLRPLDPVRSLKGKLIVIIAATVTMYALITWLGDRLAGL